MTILRVGSTGPEVEALQRALFAAGFDPHGDDGVFGTDTRVAVVAFQTAHPALAVDGEVDWPNGETATALRPLAATAPAPTPVPAPAQARPLTDITASITTLMVARMFPGTLVVNIGRNLPPVLLALSNAALGDRDMVLMALGTIRAETASFEPIVEGQSKYNSSRDDTPFDLYDFRKDLGNHGVGMGLQYRGRGFVQLTGAANYAVFGAAIGVNLVGDPAKACDPTIAARVLAAFLKAQELKIRAALAAKDLATARRLVNGGAHGLDAFIDTYRRGLAALPA